PGFRVAHYSIQDDHAHFLIEAAGARRLANGMKSLAARFARCVNRVFGRKGRVLAGRFHHVLKRTPTEVRRALAYVLLNARQRYCIQKVILFQTVKSIQLPVDPTNDHLPVPIPNLDAPPERRKRSVVPVRSAILAHIANNAMNGVIRRFMGTRRLCWKVGPWRAMGNGLQGWSDPSRGAGDGHRTTEARVAGSRWLARG
ncbi:MAG: hypothetical protein OXH52_06990, partial [Gammaproteobacteria bacterium]|nr:hypothetical protein [Gammaproteobacteria bacterium]